MTVSAPIVKDRILLHLYDYRSYAGEYDVPVDMTQEGIARAVWIDIRHVVQYVRPLIGEGLVKERVAHIHRGRRRRKVYDLTDSGKLAAYKLRKKISSNVVHLRDSEGVREARVSEIMEQTGGELSPLEILRQVVHAGAVDIRRPKPVEPTTYFEMLADAPKVEDFIGREKELEKLTRSDRLPAVFVVLGVAGIGKSTLAAKVCEVLRDSRNIFWYRVRPWDTPQSILAALGTFLSALGKPGLKALLAEGQVELAPQLLKDDLPGVKATLVLDDAHDAGSEVQSFFQFLKDAVSESPEVKLLVLTRRALSFYDRRDVVLEGLVEEITLGGLELEAIRTFVTTEEKLDLPEDLARHPLFLKLLRSTPNERPRSEALRDIHQFIRESVYTELSEAERKMMKMASLYGVPVPPEALFLDSSLSHDILLELTDRALISPVGSIGVEVHDTIKDFFASLVTASEKKELGEWALPQLRDLSAQARDRGDLSLCIGYLSSALRLSPSGLELLAVWEALGDVKERIGDLTGSLEAYRQGLEATTHPELTARLRRKMASALVSRGEILPAAAAIEKGFRALGSRVSVESGWLNLARCRLAEWQEEDEEAREYGIVALKTFQAFGEMSGQGQALMLLGHLESGMTGGKPSVARDYLERALDLADVMDDPGFPASVHLELAMLCAFPLGDLEKAEEHLTTVEALLDDSMRSFKLVNFLMVKGMFSLHFQADYRGAETLFERAMEEAKSLRSSGRVAFARYAIAQVAHYQERFEEARQEFQAFARDIQRRGLPGSAVEALCMAAECSLLEGNLEEFRGIVRALQDQELAPGVEARPMMTGVVLALNRFLEGDFDGSLDDLREAADAEEGGMVFDPALPHLVYGIVLRLMGQEEEGLEHAEAAASVLEALSRKAEVALLPTRERLLTQALRGAMKVP